MILNVNTDALVKYTNTLEKLHRSAFPSAIRGALNDTVFDIKTRTMPKIAASTFLQRSPNFFKANSRFENAKGFDIGAMKASVGFISSGLKGSNNYSVKDLEQQEYGGSIKRRSFIALSNARGGTWNKNVKPGSRLSSINNLVDSSKESGRNDREKFRKAVHAAGVGGFVLGNRDPKILWKVNSLKRTKDMPYKLTALYSFDKGRSVDVDQHLFMKRASIESGRKLNDFYVKQAERQISKFR